jgi:putative transposase
LVLRAEEWRWSSLWRRVHGTQEEQSLLADWPIGRQSNWLDWVNQAETEQELESLRKCVQRGRPFGGALWQKEIAQRLGLESAYRPIGRPCKLSQRKVAGGP